MTAPTPGTPATAFVWSDAEREVAFHLLPNSLRATSPGPYLSDRILDELAPVVAAREAAAYARGRADADAESDKIRARMASLLTDTANALKGDPGPLTAHDWSDLPRLAGHQFRRLAAAERRGAERERGRLDQAARRAHRQDLPPRHWAHVATWIKGSAAAAVGPGTTPEGDPS